MEFFTPVSAPPAPFTYYPQDGTLLLGSCFSDNIGERLALCDVPTSVNPFGPLYNPLSIAAALETALTGKISDTTIFCYQERWRSWLMSTKFSSPDKIVASALHSTSLCNLICPLVSYPVLVVTFGTAWIYEHIPSDTSSYSGIVANCHKVPAREFTRRRLSVEEIVNAWTLLLCRLHHYNPELQFIFTVSPIRHFKDGARENTLSKATLHLAVQELVTCASQLGLDADYFPAYEILMDELRDYRFYAPDMLHPSTVAADLIFQRFIARYAPDANLRPHSQHRPNLT